ncbi:MAG: PKD domain-containing protein, partial [Bacteroidota bacterium]
DFSNQPIDNFPVYYFAFDTASGNIDSGMVVTNPSGNYATTLNVTPVASSIVEIFWQDCNSFSSATFAGQNSIVQDIQTCAIPCNASFSYSGSALNPFDITFFVQQPGPGTYTWDFGDGTTGSGPQAQHTYNSSGPFTACLLYDDGSGCTDSVCQTVVISFGSGNCDASFTATPDTSNNSVALAAQTIDPDWQYTWYLGDGNFGFGPTLIHTYTNPGIYHIILEVVDSASFCIDTTSQVLIIGGGGGGSGTNCDASFFFTPDSAVGGNPYTYSFYPISPAAVTSYQWDFGDGSNSTSAFVSHTYNAPGTYNVCLIVFDGTCSDTSCTSLTVNQYTPNCDASFNSSPFSP